MDGRTRICGCEKSEKYAQADPHSNAKDDVK